MRRNWYRTRVSTASDAVCLGLNTHLKQTGLSRFSRAKYRDKILIKEHFF